MGVNGKGSMTVGADGIGDKTFTKSFSATAEAKMEVFAAAGSDNYTITTAQFMGNLKKQ